MLSEESGGSSHGYWFNGREVCHFSRCSRSAQRAGRLPFHKLSVPFDGPRESLFQVEPRTPAEAGASFRCIKILMEDLVIGFAADVQFEIVAAREAQDQLREFQNRHLNLVAEVERLARKFRSGGQLLLQHHVRQRAIFYIEIIADVAAVAPNDRGL